MTMPFSEEKLTDEKLLSFQVDKLTNFLIEIGLSEKQIKDNLIYQSTEARKRKMENKIFRKLSKERLQKEQF